MIEFYEVMFVNEKDHILERDSFHMTLESAEKRVARIKREQQGRISFFEPVIKPRKFADGPQVTEFEIPLLANFSNTRPKGVLGKGRIINSGTGSAIFIMTNEPFDPKFLDGMVEMSFAWCPANPYLIEHFYKETNG